MLCCLTSWKPQSLAGLKNPTAHIMCLLAGTGQSPIYNEPLTAWSRAHAQSELDCCSPRQGGPLPSKHCTAQGLTTTIAPGIDRRNTARVITTQTLLNTVSINARAGLPCVFHLYFFVRVYAYLQGVALGWVGGEGCCALFPCSENIFPCTVSPEVFREACRGGRLESSTPTLRLFYPNGTPAKTGTFIVLSSGSKCQTPAHLFVVDFGVFAPFLLQSLLKLLKGLGWFFRRIDLTPLFVRRSRYNNPYLSWIAPSAKRVNVGESVWLRLTKRVFIIGYIGYNHVIVSSSQITPWEKAGARRWRCIHNTVSSSESSVVQICREAWFCWVAYRNFHVAVTWP